MKSFQKSVFILCLLLALPLQAAIPNTGSLNLSLKKGGHQVTLNAKSIPFNHSSHSGEKDFIGTDGGKPSTEFDFIKVSLDGKEIPINKKWYQDLYNPNLTKESFKIALGDDLKTVWAYMSGSDAAGHYDVIWVFPVIGPPSRIVSQSSDSNLCDLSIFDEMSKGNFHEVK